MELSDYVRVLRRRGWVIILLAILTAGATFGYSRMQEPVYTSTVRLLITSRPDFGQTQAAKALLRDFAAWMRSSYRAAEVINELDLDQTPPQLLADVSIAASDSENIITIEVENTEQAVASDIARTWGRLLIDWRNQENAGLRQEDRISAQFLDDPLPGAPQPNVRINTLAGAIFGAILGVAVIFALEWFESGVMRRPEDIERYLDIPVIGNIPD